MEFTSESLSDPGEEPECVGVACPPEDARVPSASPAMVQKLLHRLAAKQRPMKPVVSLSRFSSPTSDDDDKKKKKRDKESTGFIGLCLVAGRRKDFCTMAGEANGARASPGGHATPMHNDSSHGSESDSEVNSTIDLLDTEVREL